MTLKNTVWRYFKKGAVLTLGEMLIVLVGGTFGIAAGATSYVLGASGDSAITIGVLAFLVAGVGFKGFLVEAINKWKAVN